ncbi:MAG: hypothetical protein AVDCRST_MAG04-1684, partial [uncultured Acetobacteraceae bacterium]
GGASRAPRRSLERVPASDTGFGQPDRGHRSRAGRAGWRASATRVGVDVLRRGGRRI